MAGATGSPKCKLCGVPHRIGAPHDAAGLKAGGPVTERVKQLEHGPVGKAAKKRPPSAAPAKAVSPPKKPIAGSSAAKLTAETVAT